MKGQKLKNVLDKSREYYIFFSSVTMKTAYVTERI